jgi:hypothetical protein
MNSIGTISYGTYDSGDNYVASGDWTFGKTDPINNGRRLTMPVRPLPRKFVGLALLFATSLTFAADPWATKRGEQSAITVTTAYRMPTRRRLSPSEARKIALDILYRAENRRKQTAMKEAACGIDWEEIA